MKYKPLPEPVEIRTGCKVGWRYYADEATAKVAAEAARYNGQIDASNGYDFGYCSPGSIRPPHAYGKDVGFYPELWEVCVS